jgi:large subunit ribosomal protein L19
MDISSLVDIKKNEKIPDIAPGDTVRVSTRIVEGDKERIQVFQGVVIKIRHGGNGASYTVRHVAFGIGVERTFPLNSPMVEKVEIVRQGKVRRARLYYLRGLSGKEARRKIKRVERRMEQVGEELLQPQPEEEIEPIMDEAAVAAAAEKAKEAEAAAAKAPEAAKEVKKEKTAKAPEAVKEVEQEPTAEKPAEETPVAEKIETAEEAAEPARDEKQAAA